MGNQLIIGSLNQTLETIRTNAASVETFVWDPTAPVVSNFLPGPTSQDSSVTISPTVLSTVLSMLPLDRALNMGVPYFGNLDQTLINECGADTLAQLGWVIRVGAFPADMTRDAAMDFIVGNSGGVYTPPPPPTSSGSNYSLGVYAKVMSTPINNSQQARNALVGSGNLITVAEDLLYINMNTNTVTNTPSTIKLYSQNSLVMPNTAGVFWREISASTNNLSYLWLATPANAPSVVTWRSNPEDFPNKVECIPCANGTKCNEKTGICTQNGGESSSDWYRSWWFITLISLVGAIIIFLLIFAIIRAAKKRKLAALTTQTIEMKAIPIEEVPTLASSVPTLASSVPTLASSVPASVEIKSETLIPAIVETVQGPTSVRLI